VRTATGIAAETLLPLMLALPLGLLLLLLLLLLRLLLPALVLSDCGTADGVAGAVFDAAAEDCCSGLGFLSSLSAGEAARAGRGCRDGGGCLGPGPVAPFAAAAPRAACGGCCRRFCCAVCWPRDCGLLDAGAPLPLPLLLGPGCTVPLLLRALLGDAESAPE
jgi:hypothetical protein